MELYIQLILILALLNYSLKAALTKRTWVMFAYAMFVSVLAMFFYPFIITQPVTILSSLIKNKTLVTDWAVWTTIESVAGIFFSVFLLENYFMPREKRKKSIFTLKVMPGLLFIVAIGYFELLFFRMNVGVDFTITALIYSVIAGVAVFLVSWLLKWALKGESMKLELKILINIGILIIGLLVHATIADYSVSNAQSNVEWGALLAFLLLFVAVFGIGFAFSKLHIKSIFKKK